MPERTLAGISAQGEVHYNASGPELIELSVKRGEATLASTGALAAYTGRHTGRSPKDRFIVAQGEAEELIDWGGFNQRIEAGKFNAIVDRVRAHLGERELFVVDGYVGADPAHRINVRVIAELAWHANFVRQLFRRPSPEEMDGFEPQFVILAAPNFETQPERDHTNSSTFVGLDLEQKLVVICGSHYAGEMKKSIFTAANYLFPKNDVLTMHCSANVDESGRSAVFFGLSGTGKTTLSADPERRLLGDDEHAWSDRGIFNLEGGCYAKCINLSPEKEPEIFSAIRFGSILENVVLDPATRQPDYDDGSLTENTRAVYPIDFIPNHVPEGTAEHPSTIVFLTADAFGVLPPISILTPEAAMYHFLSGFTSKLAGTEVGLGEEPEETFSTCFGAPFLPLPPISYAEMLGDRISRHSTDVFLVNTGWTGGPYGVGHRMDLGVTRAIVQAATSGALRGVATKHHEIFNLDVPVTCPGVPDDVLDPQSTWPDADQYRQAARDLAQRFQKNFDRFAGSVPAAVRNAGPVEI